ncbi:MAG: hypothetical protein F6K42_09870 [Leptolyngbya sp. SIO1D8]|nr:hypothetical protein [Leptolyngbya sp. SIO1D8]
MKAPISSSRKSKGFIGLTTLALFAFYSAFFPRVLTLLKFPSIINLAHLGLVPAICLLTLFKTRVRDTTQIAIAWELLAALMLFLGANFASALWNDAGLVNALMNFLLFCEHFLILLVVISLPLTTQKLNQFRTYIIFASFTNTLFAYAQRYVLKLHLRQGLSDNIKGVFVGGGAGHVVGASVALTFGIYYFFAAKSLPIWLRASVLLLTFWHMNMADAKQVLLVFLISGILLLLSKFQDVAAAFKYLTAAVLLGYVLYWATQNIPALDAFNTWARPEIYGPEGEATLLKTAAFRIVPEYFNSFLDPFLGLGPGHTVGRLGGWMIREYNALLGPLGATTHPASGKVWQAVGASWLGSQSSMFSPLFGWAGIWGDLGWFGLISFLYIWFVVWRRLCFDDVSKFLVLTVLVFGLIFTQMEEPGYTIYIAMILGLRWQEHRFKQKNYVNETRLTRSLNWKSPKALMRSLLLTS